MVLHLISFKPEVEVDLAREVLSKHGLNVPSEREKRFQRYRLATVDIEEHKAALVEILRQEETVIAVEPEGDMSL